MNRFAACCCLWSSDDSSANGKCPARGSAFPARRRYRRAGTGPTIAAAFEQAALAMMAVITDPPTVRLKQTVEIICAAPNAELLLLDWLNAIIFEVATRSMIFGAFEVKTDGKQLHGMAHGEPISRERHKPAVEIKGATFTELRVIEESPGHWQAQCVVDV